MQTIIAQNAHGVQALASGNDHAAAEAFKQTLVQLRDACNVLDGSQQQQTCQIPNSANISVTMYGRGFLINTPADSGNYADFTLCSAIVMLNLGMTIQHKACFTSHCVPVHKANPVPFAKASMFYRKTLELLSILPDTLEKVQIAAASLTHLADACYTLGDFQGQRSAVDSLFFLNLGYQIHQDQAAFQQADTIAPAA